MKKAMLFLIGVMLFSSFALATPTTIEINAVNYDGTVGSSGDPDELEYYRDVTYPQLEIPGVYNNIGFIDFNTSAIPDTARIDDVTLSLNVEIAIVSNTTLSAVKSNLQINEDNYPDTNEGNQVLWNDLNSADVYDIQSLKWSDRPETEYFQNWSLISAATDLQNRLLEDYFSVGLTYEDSGAPVRLTSSEGSEEEKRPKLIVTYTERTFIGGTVKDENEEPVPGANVVVCCGDAEPLRISSNEEGNYGVFFDKDECNVEDSFDVTATKGDSSGISSGIIEEDSDIVIVDVNLNGGSAPTVGSYDSSGAIKNQFLIGEDVYAKGNGFDPDTLVDIYIINDYEGYLPINSSLVDVSDDGVETVPIDNDGKLPLTKVWGDPKTNGRYDIYVDSNRNGKFDGLSTEPVNDGIEIGFEVIPEFTTFTALITLLAAGLLFFILRRK